MSKEKKEGILAKTAKLPFRYLVNSTKSDRSYFNQRVDSIKLLAEITKKEIAGTDKKGEPIASDIKDYRLRYRNARITTGLSLASVILTAFIMMTASSLEMLLISIISFGGLFVIYIRLTMVLLKARIAYSNFNDTEYRRKQSLKFSDFLNRVADKPSILLPLPIDSKEARI